MTKILTRNLLINNNDANNLTLLNSSFDQAKQTELRTNIKTVKTEGITKDQFVYLVKHIQDERYKRKSTNSESQSQPTKVGGNTCSDEEVDEYMTESVDYEELERNALCSLSKISLQKCSQPIIFQPAYIKLIINFISLSINQLNDIFKMIHSAQRVIISKDRIIFLYKRILECLRTVTNCLMFPQNKTKMFGGNPYLELRSFLIKNQSDKLISLHAKIIEITKHKGDETKTKDDKKSKLDQKIDEIKRYESDIKSECKVALLLIEDKTQVKGKDLPMGDVIINSDIIKIDFLMKNILKGSDYLICKSLSCFKKMLDDSSLSNSKESIKNYLCNTTEFLRNLCYLLDNPNSCIVREVCSVLSCLVSKPDGMTCWLKFDNSDNIGVDSSCIRHIRIYGKPQKIPKNTGYKQLMRKSQTISGIMKGITHKMSQAGMTKVFDRFATSKEETKMTKEAGDDVYVEEFLNWGVIINYGDLLEVMPPIKVSEGTAPTSKTNNYITRDETSDQGATDDFISLDWTVMLMIHFPPIISDDDHVLLESENGDTIHFYFLNDFSKFCVKVDSERHEPYSANFEHRNYEGWKHLIVRYTCPHIQVYIDCIELGNQITDEIRFVQPIRYIGNNKSGSKPIGMISDFRFYPYSFNIREREKEIAEEVKFIPTDDDKEWKEQFEVNDMSIYIYEEPEIIEKLVQLVEQKSDIPATLTEIVKTLANLCAHPVIRSEIISMAGIELLMKGFSNNSLVHFPLNSIPKDKDVDMRRLMSEGDLNKEIMRFYFMIS